jgi:hypothetical protein
LEHNSPNSIVLDDKVTDLADRCRATNELNTVFDSKGLSPRSRIAGADAERQEAGNDHETTLPEGVGCGHTPPHGQILPCT